MTPFMNAFINGHLNVFKKSKCIVLKDTDLNGKTSHRCFQDDLSSLRSPLDMKKQSVFSSIWIQVNTFKIVFWLNAALGFWRLRSKGILVGRWSVKQRKHSVTRHWDNRLSRNIQGHHLRGTAFLSIPIDWLASLSLSSCGPQHILNRLDKLLLLSPQHCHNLEKRLINIHNPMTLQVSKLQNTQHQKWA